MIVVMVVVLVVDVHEISKVKAIVQSPLGAFEVMMQLYDYATETVACVLYIPN